MTEKCGCGHDIKEHGPKGCTEWWRYPDVLNARQCGCPHPKGWKRDD